METLTRVLLYKPLSTWEELRNLEQALKEVLPGALVMNGDLNNPLPVSIEDRESDPDIRPQDIRGFAVEGVL